MKQQNGVEKKLDLKKLIKRIDAAIAKLEEEEKKGIKRETKDAPSFEEFMKQKERERKDNK